MNTCPPVASPHGATPVDSSHRLEKSQRIAVLLAATVLSLACCCVAVATITFAAGGSLAVWTLPLSATVTGAWAWWWARRQASGRSGVMAAVVMAAALLVVAAGAVVGGAMLDSTLDGQWFHREAIIQLAEGWNPLLGELSATEVADDDARGRINGYPKAPWILAAALLLLGGSIESASAFSFALLVAAAATVYAATVGLGELGRGRAAALAAVAALNPVTVFQLANPLVDGQLASILLIVVAAGLLVCRTGSGLGLAVLVMAVAYGINVKQSALPFLVLVVSGLLVSAVVVARRLPSRRRLGALGASFVVGVVGIGAHPHVTNLTRHHNWAYPYESDNVTGKLPPAIRETRIGRVHAFVVSALSRSQHTDTLWSSRQLLRTGAHLKLPFSVSSEELAEFRYHGVRIGGWGPLYGAMLLTALIALAVLARRHPERAARAALLVMVVAVSVLAFPYPWVARLVPHAWLLPLVPAAAALTSARRAVVALGWTVVTVAAVNVSSVAWVNTTATARHSSFLRDRFALLADGPTRTIDFGAFRAERLRLVDHGVQFTEVQDAGYWLGVLLGWAVPDVESAGPLSGADGSYLRLQWREVHGALEYVIQVIEAPPAGPGGGALTVHSCRVRDPEATVPRPQNSFSVTVAACNHLGCGPPVAYGPMDGADENRLQPYLGSPSPGDALTTPVLLVWLPVLGAPRHRLVVEDAATGERVIDECTAERAYPASLPTNGHWRARVVAEGAGTHAASRTVEFRTTTLNAPAPLQPEIGSTLAEGAIRLRWSAVDRASAYEFLVMVPGSRRAAARGVVTGLTARVALPARDGPTRYSAIVRACPEDAVCRGGRDRGWGQWSTEAGTGATTFTVVPSPDAPGPDG